jgi:hypothetical protein
MPSLGTWMDMETIMSREVSQTQKDKHQIEAFFLYVEFRGGKKDMKIKKLGVWKEGNKGIEKVNLIKVHYTKMSQ